MLPRTLVLAVAAASTTSVSAMRLTLRMEGPDADDTGATRQEAQPLLAQREREDSADSDDAEQHEIVQQAVELQRVE